MSTSTLWALNISWFVFATFCFVVGFGLGIYHQKALRENLGSPAEKGEGEQERGGGIGWTADRVAWTEKDGWTFRIRFPTIAQDFSGGWGIWYRIGPPFQSFDTLKEAEQYLTEHPSQPPGTREPEPSTEARIQQKENPKEFVKGRWEK